MLFAALSLLSALPLALAAPTCSLKSPSATSSSFPSTPSGASSTTPSGGSTAGAGTNGKIAMAWFANWHPNEAVANISWAHYTHMAFFTAQLSPQGTIELQSGADMVDQFTAAATANGVKPILTIGGWTGSLYYSASVATAENRTNAINSTVAFAHAHGFTGLDIDWEYPNNLGVGCNTKSPQDSANLLLFLQELRQAAPNLTISAATGIKPWLGSDGNPMTNVSAYADALDWIELMNYDVYGSFSTVTGPNSPLNDSCVSNTADRQGSAVAAVSAWTQAGFPANKLVLGVAGYGHSFNVPQSTAVTGNTLNIFTSFDKTNIPIGDSWSTPSTGPDVCGNAPVGNGNTGIYNFWALMTNGYLDQNGTAASGKVGLFDQCSQTPFVYDPTSSTLVSYDNPESFAAKGKFISSMGLGGSAMYEAGSDYQGMLAQAVSQAMA